MDSFSVLTGGTNSALINYLLLLTDV